VPLSISSSAALLSDAALAPMAGLPPAPRPRVSLAPIWTLLSAEMGEVARACECGKIMR